MKVTANINGERVTGTARDLGLIHGQTDIKYSTEYTFNGRLYVTSVSERECIKHGNSSDFRIAWDIQQLADQGVNDVTFGDREVELMDKNLGPGYLVNTREPKAQMSIDDKLDAIMQKVNKIEEDLLKLRNELSMTFGDEFNPKRKELSQELAGRMITKLKGEFQAREMTAPTGNYWCDACSTAHARDFVCLECLNKGKK